MAKGALVGACQWNLDRDVCTHVRKALCREEQNQRCGEKHYELWAREPSFTFLPWSLQMLVVRLPKEERMGNNQRKSKNHETSTFTRTPVLV